MMGNRSPSEAYLCLRGGLWKFGFRNADLIPVALPGHRRFKKFEIIKDLSTSALLQ